MVQSWSRSKFKLYIPTWARAAKSLKELVQVPIFELLDYRDRNLPTPWLGRRANVNLKYLPSTASLVGLESVFDTHILVYSLEANLLSKEALQSNKCNNLIWLRTRILFIFIFRPRRYQMEAYFLLEQTARKMQTSQTQSTHPSLPFRPIRNKFPAKHILWPILFLLLQFPLLGQSLRLAF